MKSDDPIDAWIERQARQAARLMATSISATHRRHERPAFGHVVIPAAGSVLASPVSAAWDPEPDYFFHWVRDSAIVMAAVVDLWDAAALPAEADRWRGYFESFVTFSLALLENDGAATVRARPFRARTTPDMRGFLRSEAEFRRLKGERLMGEPRFNPDGTLDFYEWSRPQYDGPALRALACMRYADRCRTEGRAPPADLWTLLGRDLDFTVRHADEPCIGPWEEPGEVGHHYYVALAQLGALVHGRRWLNEIGAANAAGRYDAAEAKLRDGLDRHWSVTHSAYVAIRGRPGGDGALDAAVILAVLDADLPDGRHSIADDRVQESVRAIEDMFARELPVNRRRPAGHGPALGRNRADRYFGGGAWFPTTLGAATFYYRLAERVRRDTGDGERGRALVRQGDAFMATVRRFMPADGTLSEQFDRQTGEPRSARNLAWSHAAFITAATARRKYFRAD